jgi:hypothetical protein
MTDDKYVVQLSDEQWQLVVDCLRFVKETAHPTNGILKIDQLCRNVVRRQIDEIVREIASNVSSVEAP